MITDIGNKLFDLHEKAKPIFTLFLQKVQAAGYDIRVNGVIYTYQKGLELHELDIRNPIFSYHTFGFAVDLNIISVDTGRIYLKKDSKEDWITTGISFIAKECGLFWGGDYLSQHDPIHFEYQIIPFAKLKELAKIQFGLNPNSEYNKIIL